MQRLHIWFPAPLPSLRCKPGKELSMSGGPSPVFSEYTKLSILRFLAEPEWPSGLQRAARMVVGSSPQTSTNARRHVCRYVDQKGSAAMLTSIQSAGVTPEVNLRNLLCACEDACKRGNPPWLWNPGQMSPEVQIGVSAVPWKDLCPPKIFKKIYIYWDFRIA